MTTTKSKTSEERLSGKRLESVTKDEWERAARVTGELPRWYTEPVFRAEIFDLLKKGRKRK